jgi:Skp family chaperone for outer membrane proteins
MRAGCGAVLLAAGLAAAGPTAAVAQAAAAEPPTMAVLTLDQDRLFTGSRFGAKSIEELEVQARALQAENRRIEGDLETEEKSLTERRAGMTPEAFRAEAEAFDAKVKGIRSAQEAKARDLAAQRDAARQRFLQASAPVLAQILRERGAVAILDRSAIVLSFDRADVTDLAIARIDAILLDGTAQPQPAPAVPAPAPAPAQTGPVPAADPVPPDPAPPPQP